MMVGYGIRWAYRSFGVWTVGSRRIFGNPRMARQREMYALEAIIGTTESRGWTKEQSPLVELEMMILRWSTVHVFLILLRPAPPVLSGAQTGRGRVKYLRSLGRQANSLATKNTSTPQERMACLGGIQKLVSEPGTSRISFPVVTTCGPASWSNCLTVLS